MKIQYQNHEKRKKVAKDFWLRVVTDYNGGMSAETIASRYRNPKTKKAYTRQHIYLILRKMRNTQASL